MQIQTNSFAELKKTLLNVNIQKPTYSQLFYEKQQKILLESIQNLSKRHSEGKSNFRSRQVQSPREKSDSEVIQYLKPVKLKTQGSKYPVSVSNHTQDQNFESSIPFLAPPPTASKVRRRRKEQNINVDERFKKLMEYQLSDYSLKLHTELSGKKYSRQNDMVQFPKISQPSQKQIMHIVYEG